MKIYIVTQNFPPKIGGIQIVMFSIAKSLSLLGNQVHIFPDKWFTKKEDFQVSNVFSPKILRPYIKKMLLSMKGDREALVICDTWKSVSAVPKKFKNIVVFAHGQEYLKSKNRGKIFECLSRTKFLISSSKYTDNLIKSCWDISHINSNVIYPTYHINNIEYVKNLKPLNKVTNFISICRIENRKGLLQSLHALKILDTEGYDFSWDIIGEGPQLLELKKNCADLKLINKIKFHGKIKKNKLKNVFLQNADVFLMPNFHDQSSVEGFGLSFVEAASYGVPSIAGINGGAPEAVINNETGWCVDPNNKILLQNVLKNALLNKKERRQYGKNALKRFKSELEGKKATKRLFNLFNIN